MPILDLQQRQRELGRIRIGHKVGPKNRPEKLDRFRFTSPSESLIRSVAEAYGGTAQPWDGNGTAQWEVITDAKRLPILVPPQPVSQWYELWSGGGCQRRCDGITEQLSDAPCLCGPDPEQRQCKPTTRLNVVLRDVHGVGVWRLESHGYYSAVEIPQTAAFLASATGQGVYLPAHLSLEERVVKRPGQQPNRFMVPTIEVDVTPAQLMAGGGGAVAIGGDGAPALPQGGPPAIEAGGGRTDSDWLALVESASTAEELRALYQQAKDANASGAVAHAITVKARQVQEKQAAAPTSDPDEVWQRIVMACPQGWTLDDLEVDFTRWSSGTAPGAADAETLGRYLDQMAGAPA